MLGAFLVFCACMGAFFWYLMVEADKERDDQRVVDAVDGGGPQQHGDRSRKRNRKKGKQHGGKRSSTKDPNGNSTAASTSNDAKGSSLNRKAAAAKKPTLDTKEWPTLGGASLQGRAEGRAEDEDEDEEEDLAALHASMLAASQTPAGAAVSATSTVRGRNSGRVGVGDKVEARFEAGVEWFPAMVTKTLHGGLVNLLYDDGERETKVPLCLVRHHGARDADSSDGDASSEPDSDSEGETADYSAPVGVRNRPRGGDKPGAGWEVMAPKPKKTSQERVETRAETSINLKNRIKRQKKRQKELAAREALRQKL